MRLGTQKGSPLDAKARFLRQYGKRGDGTYSWPVWQEAADNLAAHRGDLTEEQFYDLTGAPKYGWTRVACASCEECYEALVTLNDSAFCRRCLECALAVAEIVQPSK